KGIVQEGHSASDFRDYAQRSHSFESLAAFRPNFAAYLPPQSEAIRLVSSLVTENFFHLLDVAPAIGRTFDRSEFSLSNARTVVLSEQTWRRHFQARPDIVGHTIQLDDEPHTVIGVTPSHFREPEFADLWLPFPREAPEYFARDS